MGACHCYRGMGLAEGLKQWLSQENPIHCAGDCGRDSGLTLSDEATQGSRKCDISRDSQFFKAGPTGQVMWPYPVYWLPVSLFPCPTCCLPSTRNFSMYVSQLASLTLLPNRWCAGWFEKLHHPLNRIKPVLTLSTKGAGLCLPCVGWKGQDTHEH